MANIKDFFHHFFLPHHSNNHRPKILHAKSLIIICAIFFFGAIIQNSIRKNFPSVLGVSSDISAQKLVLFTNEKRKENGSSPLVLDSRLSLAAEKKAEDMFSKNYWAHIAPDGKTPWVFIKNAGFDYVYAGENLARGFNNSSDVVGAWMASSEHKKNMLSSNFSNVGFAVKSGRLNGEETVLVVEMLGSTSFGVQKEFAQNPQVSEIKGIEKPLINASVFSSSLAQAFLIILISVLTLDLVIVKRQKIVRFVGHNADHILFLGTILLIIIILARGVII